MLLLPQHQRRKSHRKNLGMTRLSQRRDAARLPSALQRVGRLADAAFVADGDPDLNIVQLQNEQEPISVRRTASDIPGVDIRSSPEICGCERLHNLPGGEF